MIGLEGVPGLLSYVDAMGGELSCRTRQVAWRVPPEDITGRCTSPTASRPRRPVSWTASGEPAALCTTYMQADIAVRPDGGGTAVLPDALNLLRLTGVSSVAGAAEDADGRVIAGVPAALHIEMQAPPPSWPAASGWLSATRP